MTLFCSCSFGESKGNGESSALTHRVILRAATARSRLPVSRSVSPFDLDQSPRLSAILNISQTLLLLFGTFRRRRRDMNYFVAAVATLFALMKTDG